MHLLALLIPNTQTADCQVFHRVGCYVTFRCTLRSLDVLLVETHTFVCYRLMAVMVKDCACIALCAYMAHIRPEYHHTRFGLPVTLLQLQMHLRIMRMAWRFIGIFQRYPR